jgi:hypothetical protein
MLKINIEKSLYELNLKLEEVKRIQQFNPLSHIGGSVALYLHGICLKRIMQNTTAIDFDICTPYYVPLTGGDNDKILIDEDSNRASDADYREVLTFNNIKVDYRVAPAEPWIIITHDDFLFKVTPLEIIMEAKFRYAMTGNKKHRDDCREISGLVNIDYNYKEQDNLPF